MYPGVGTFVLIRPAQTFYERIKIDDLVLKVVAPYRDGVKRTAVEILTDIIGATTQGSSPIESRQIENDLHGQLNHDALSTGMQINKVEITGITTH